PPGAQIDDCDVVEEARAPGDHPAHNARECERPPAWREIRMARLPDAMTIAPERRDHDRALLAGRCDLIEPIALVRCRGIRDGPASRRPGRVGSAGQKAQAGAVAFDD